MAQDEMQASGSAADAGAEVSSSSQSSGRDGGLGDIVVTAQRREERVQTVPISVTALGGSDLGRNSIKDVGRLEFAVPAFTMARTGSDSRPSLRGVRTEAITATADPTIGFYVDGVYQSRPALGTMPFVDVQRVEVQEGPQGTLYGRNTYGGNISLTNNRPVDHFEAGLTGEVGNFSLYRMEGFINLPVNDQLQVRVAGLISTQRGYVKSTANPDIALGGENDGFVRGTIKWTPTDRLTVLLIGGYWRRWGQGAGQGYKVSGTLIDPSTGLRSATGVPYAVNPTVVSASNPTIVAGVNVGVPVTTGPYVNDWDYKPYEHTHDVYQTMDLSYDVGDFATIHSITGHTKFRSDRTWDADFSSISLPAAGVSAFYAGSAVSRVDAMDEAFSEEFQLVSRTTTPFQWIVGGYYLHDHIYEKNPYIYLISANSTANDTVSSNLVKLNAVAAFAQASYYVLPDKLRVTGGVRYTREDKSILNVNLIMPETGGVITGPPRIVSTGGGSKVFTRPTYHAGVDFFIAPKSMAYFSYSTGYNSGGFNNNAASSTIPATYGPQTVTAFEVGVKNTFFSNTLQLNVAAFHNSFDNLQLQVFNPQTGLSYLGNIGAAVAKGGELSAIWHPVRRLQLSGSFAYLDAHFTDYTRPNLFTSAGQPKTVDLAGNRIPMSPRFKSVLTGSYDFDIASVGTVTPYFAYTHSSKYYGQDQNYLLDLQKPLDKLDLAVTIAPLSWHDMSMRLYVNNITNVAQLERVVYGPNQRAQVSYGPPRMYGMSITKAFR